MQDQQRPAAEITETSTSTAGRPSQVLSSVISESPRVSRVYRPDEALDPSRCLKVCPLKQGNQPYWVCNIRTQANSQGKATLLEAAKDMQDRMGGETTSADLFTVAEQVAREVVRTRTNLGGLSILITEDQSWLRDDTPQWNDEQMTGHDGYA